MLCITKLLLWPIINLDPRAKHKFYQSCSANENFSYRLIYISMIKTHIDTMQYSVGQTVYCVSQVCGNYISRLFIVKRLCAHMLALQTTGKSVRQSANCL